jgi:formamidopyrimidine-DNA glycosylase
MPELPEVETVRKGLQNLEGKKVKSVFRSDKKMRIVSTLDLEELKNAKILEINRRARYLIINFDNKKSLIIHLGMSGKITLKHEFNKLKHDHFALEFANLWLIFNDPRRFGFIDLIENKNIKNHKMLSKLGPEPLSAEFNLSDLKEKLSRKKMNIKTTMMDNEIVVGVGNIYINESLFDSKISPLRDANSLSDAELKKLISSIKKIIAEAIELGGSSINDYVDAKGDLGNFQNNFKVYGRENKKSCATSEGNCLLCKNLIRKIKQNGRSSFYCAQCQK